MQIAVIIRVYNRLDDLNACLSIIKNTWTKHSYYIIVVSNGISDGYSISNDIRNNANIVYEINENKGHLSGNSQLLQAGIPLIPKYCDFTIILEADTWIYKDKIIDKYVNKLSKSTAVWASADWIAKYHSLALDFAIIKTKFLQFNTDIFSFRKKAECCVCNYLKENNYDYMFIKEAMPVHYPKLMKIFYNPDKGRTRIFLKIPMITHHIEDLKYGILEKKIIANFVFKKEFFKINNDIKYQFNHNKIILINRIMKAIYKLTFLRTKKIRS